MVKSLWIQLLTVDHRCFVGATSRFMLRMVITPNRFSKPGRLILIAGMVAAQGAALAQGSSVPPTDLHRYRCPITKKIGVR